MQRFNIPLGCLIVVGLFLGLLSLPAFGFIGASRCGECHQYEYSRWQQGAHARATTVLAKDKQRKSTCLWCHTTDGSQVQGGYKHAGVQCEGCHGEGGHYAFADVMRKPQLAKTYGLVPQSHKVCLKCHAKGNSPSLLEFDYRKALLLIRHWR